MVSTVFAEAFGQLLPYEELTGIDAEEEDLYSVFYNRANLMLLSAPATPRPIWGMNEAELTADPSGRIGYVQVGAETEFDIIDVLVPLFQCFDDALRRFGEVELTGLQVTASYVEPPKRSWMPDSNWFNLRRGREITGLVTCSQQLLGDSGTADIAANLSRRSEIFKYRNQVPAPVGALVEAPKETPFIPVSPGPDGLGIPVVLPEWTADAAAWVMAGVVDIARAKNPDVRNLAVRLTRTG